MTGDTTAQGAAAAFTAVMAEGESGGSPPRLDTHDRVTIQMPAEGAYLSVLRTATAGLAARLDFTVDEIEDLRIAVDEACGILLAQAAPEASLSCEFSLSGESIGITVSTTSERPQPPARDTFAWTVLSALAGSAEAWVGPDGLLTVELRKTREASRFG